MNGTSRTVSSRLGIGLIGSGFNARFHMQAFQGVRDAEVRGVCDGRVSKRRGTANPGFSSAEAGRVRAGGSARRLETKVNEVSHGWHDF
jgi:ornithine cyclodeaminase/alanine dehydrogenase-like protein (mu-crystallin family)